VVLEVTNMDDAVRMAQRLTEKGDTVLLSPACVVLICLKIMRIEESI
jgi:UDP-N-acetylmuramoylalanine-D-glutamate ligase